MEDKQNKRLVTLATVICLTVPCVTQLPLPLIYPPDLSGEFPVYDPDGVLILQFGGAFLLLGLTILGMKAEGEGEILPAAGFTAQAIAMGLAMASLFEVTQAATREAYEKFYYLTVTSNFIYFPSLLMIATYRKFKKWIRLAGFIASLPLLVSTFMFVGKYRNYIVLETISSTGYGLMMIVWVLWAVNLYGNYRKEVSDGAE